MSLVFILMGIGVVLLNLLLILSSFMLKQSSLGCPGCRRKSGLVYMGHNLVSRLLSIYGGRITRMGCSYCGWTGSLKQ